MNEEIIYKKGDKVLYRKQMAFNQIWTVIKVDLKARRCTIKRSTPDKTFQRTAGFKFLMLEADLPRRPKADDKLKVKPPKAPSQIKKPKQPDKDKSIMMTFERVAAIIKLIHSSQATVNNQIIHQKIMPEASYRTVQRYTEALCKTGYLGSIHIEAKELGFFLKSKAREMFNLNSATAQSEEVTAHG